MRSQGQVRFLKVSSRLQMTAAGVAAGAALTWAVSMGTVALLQYQASSQQASLLDREATVARSEDRLAAYRDDIASTTADLSRRQELLEQLTAMLPEEVLADEEGEDESDTTPDTVSDSSGEAERLISMVRESFPEAEGLARIEARQLAFVERLTRYADRRADRAEQAMRTLGIDPLAVLRAGGEATGGPLELVASNADGSIDPRFERLGLSLVRMAALERGLDGIPQVMPADEGSISSGFGYRRDPFTGRAAMHGGLDFKAAHGSPIRAAAEGRVTFAGWKPGYGKVVEISHGSGMVTRYAHMSRWTAQVGNEVLAGEVIGAIGSTGRSTGAHLHFEVRINDRPLNPRPFLETAPDVLEKARAHFAHPSGTKVARHGE